MESQFTKLINSFGYAINGLGRGLKERNFKIHLSVFSLVLIMAVGLKISALEWVAIFILSGIVMVAELFNTAVEEICDLMALKLQLKFSDTTTPRDLGAAAVLLTAKVAALGGLIIFVPKILRLF